MPEKATIKIITERTLLLPTLPNYMFDEYGGSFPVESLTVEQIREIGIQWTEALVRKAATKRKEITRKINKSIAAHAPKE